MLQQALKELEPTEHYFDASGTKTISWDYLISDLDRAGLLKWQTQYDHRPEPEPTEELVTVYALRPEISAYKEEPLFYDTLNRKFDSHVALTERLNIPSWTDVFKNGSELRDISEASLGHILQFGIYAYRDRNGFRAEHGYEPPADF